MGKLATWITGRRSKILVAVLFTLLAGGLASQAGNSEMASGPTVRLPAGSESRAALDAVDQFPTSDVTTAVTVAYRDGGLTATDRAGLRQLRTDIGALDLPGTVHSSPVRPSDNGSGAVLRTQLGGLDDDAVDEAVEAIRSEVADVEGDSLRVAVTGEAAFSADIASIFDGINGILLIGAAALVLLLLIAVYRSPVFWLIPFVTVLLAEGAQRGAQYFLGQSGLPITGQAAGIASVLTFGAATDYALLLVARYREELLVRDDRHEAMRRALRSATPAIVASAGTVVLALLTLLLAEVGSSSALGPLGATGVLLAMVLSLTLLPALLLIAGRGAFWPRVPRVGSSPPDPLRGVWGRLGRRVRRHPRPVWSIGAAALVVLSLGLTQLTFGLAPDAQFATEKGSVTGQKLLDTAGFDISTPGIRVVVPDRDRAEQVVAALDDTPDVARTDVAERGRSGALLNVTLRADRFSAAALSSVPDVRAAVHEAAADAVVGGQDAQEFDTRQAATRDNYVVVPVVLAVVLLILLLLLRALVLPLLLMASVLLSAAAAFGVGVLISHGALGYAGMSASVPLIAFVFLVALGVDYNIFLIDRARQEAREHGTSAGLLRALASTGGVITSAGIVLAGTFSILILIPFVPLIQVGMIIAFGVLLDTLIVRSIIVPAAVWDIGSTVWWPAGDPCERQPVRDNIAS